MKKIKLGDAELSLDRGKFNQKSWEKLLDQIADKEVVLYKGFNREEMGVIVEETSWGPRVKFFRDIVSLLYCEDPLKETTGKLCSERNLSSLGIFKDLPEIINIEEYA